MARQAAANNPIRDRTIPMVAARLKIAQHQLRRAANKGDVKTQTWAGTRWIAPDEEERLRQLLATLRTPLVNESEVAYRPDLNPSTSVEKTNAQSAWAEERDLDFRETPAAQLLPTPGTKPRAA
jgi:hypothetical protein